ncbi:MAG: hypothetical protein Q8O31_02305 [Rhodocyclaceae bacterium]|nr:hypothetical protein [Rhodocyclaceae bacterium]
MDNVKELEEACGLERIGHVCQKICASWGKAELNRYISGLILDSRGGHRQGFPMDVAAELFFLAQANQTVRALTLAENKNISFEEATQLIEEHDQVRLAENAFDDPMVSHDAIVRQDRRRADRGGRRTIQVETNPSKATTLQVVIDLVTNRTLLLLVVFVLTVKLVWPYLMTALFPS